MKENDQIRLFDNRKLAALLIPLALDQLLNSFMGSVDTFVVSNLGSAAISAVSLVDSINMLIVQAFFALASGGTVVCSHYLGCRKEKLANDAAGQLVFITLTMSTVIAVLCLIFNGQILGLIFGDVEPAVMENAQKYFFISAISYPFIALYDDGSSILRAQENSRFPMMISVAANVLNLVLNLIFVWGMHLGVAGSAFATLMARIFSMAVVMIRLRKSDLEIRLRGYLSIRPDWPEIRRILNIGIPSGVENGMFQFGKLAIQSTVSLMGTTAIAAQGMASTFENLNGILAVGIGVGLMTVVGETLGAGRKEEAVYYVKKLCVVSEAVILLSCLILYLLVRPVTHFGGMEPESARMCIYMVGWISLVKPVVWVMSFIPAYGFRAAGDVKFTMTVSVLSMWLCRVTLTIVLARVFGMGPMAVWIGMFTDWTVRCVIYTIRFRSRRWLAHRVI